MTDYLKEYRKRIDRLQLLNDKSLQAKVQLYYASNPVNWINDWCVTYNPRNKKPLPKQLPFILFPKQVEFVEFLQDCLNTGQSGLIEKSRDIGATWVSCAFTVWLWIYVPECSIGWGSRKEMLVDRLGDPDSIFQKMRMIMEGLPKWMLPAGFDIKQHATYMKIINPQTGATITGEAGANIGRGGRKTIYFKDEAAHYEQAEAIEAALGDNTDVQIDISSVMPNTIFQRRREAGEVWSKGHNIARGTTRVFVFDWRDHPNKTQEWYDERRKKAQEEGLLHLFAQEVDRDYSASLDRVIIPTEWIKSAIDAHIKLNWSDEGMRAAGVDIADEGGDKNALAITHGSLLIYCDAWGEGDTGETARRAIQQATQMRVRELYYDSIGVGSGFKAETNRMTSEELIDRNLRIFPWNAASPPLDKDDNMIRGDMQTLTNGDFFGSMKAQAWWRLRIRFEKSYKNLTQGAKYPQEECISLPKELPKLHSIIQEVP